MVSDDVILEQVENVYDPAGNVILTITRQRYHNAPDNQTGPLQDPSTTPKARVTYVAFYHDPIGRIIATADYGTNGGVPLTRSPTIPASSDTVLVTRTRYDRAGNVDQTIDPSGMVTMYEHDAARRKTKVIENYQATSSSSSSSSGGCEPSDDANRTTRFTYTPDGQQATLTAENPRTGDQTTTWTFGTTLADSEIASSQLLRSVAYPDSTGPSDKVLYSYNRQGERTTQTDQRGCVHTYDRDKLGRVIHDRVTTLGSGVDGAIRRLSTSYDVRGLTSKLTSWNNASVNSGDVVNECQLAYNNFRQLIADYQNHGGAVNTSTTPKVQYGYADGSANTIRPITLTYPNGRVITYDYGTADGINDAASRIASLIDDDDTHLVDYSFLGQGFIVVVDYTEPDVKYTLVDLSGTNDSDTGDIYSGLDRFGRVKDCRWYDYGNTADTVRLKYGYDRASNRLWRADLVAQSLSKDFDELYSYDGLHRLKDMQRGLLNGSNTAVTNATFGQCWSLDPTSNWHGFKEAAAGGSWTLDQSRSANTVNEITGITNSTGPTWVAPAYDTAGNTTTIPQPADPTESYTGTYDAWNRLAKLTDDATDDTVQENQYDARTFRVARKDYTAGVLAETRHFYYTSRWQSMEERLGSSPNSTDAERQFVWGRRYIDDLVLRDRDTDDDGTLDERLYGLQDTNWNMVALIDTSATAQERYLYSPFGWPMILNGTMSATRVSSAVDIECLFTGQRLDGVAQMYYFRMRFFCPLIGRYFTRDPLIYVDGANAYAGWFVPHKVDSSGQQAATPNDIRDKVKPDSAKYCKIAVHCYPVANGLDNHCGISMDIGHGQIYWIDGAPSDNPVKGGGWGGDIFVGVTPKPYGPGKDGYYNINDFKESSFGDFPMSACKCITGFAIAITVSKFDYFLTGPNSNWSLQCMLDGCKIKYGFGIIGGKPPIGSDNGPCVQWLGPCCTQRVNCVPGEPKWIGVDLGIPKEWRVEW